MSRSSRPVSVALLVIALLGVVRVLLPPSDATAHAYACEPSPPGVPELCVHGSQKPPPGVSTTRRPSLDELQERRQDRRRQRQQQVATDADGSEATTAETSWDIACLGDGVSGNRVQAIYAHPSNVASRFTDLLPLLQAYAADVDLTVSVAATNDGGERRVRFVTHDCVLDVAEVTLTSSGDDTFSNTINELKAQGFDHTDRKYLVWVDTAVSICGIAQVYLDDRPGQDNWNNRGPQFARVDAPCWDYAEAHEVLHTLGAVQPSAPHASAAGHCTDEYDVMCYADGSDVVMTVECSTAAWNHVDCQQDDYFAISPAEGSYLDTHWNTADNAFLEVAASESGPTVSLDVPSAMWAGEARAVSAVASSPDGDIVDVQWASSRSDCRLGNTASPTTRLWCQATSIGSGYVTVTVTDAIGQSRTEAASFSLAVPSTPRDTGMRIRRSASAITYGNRVTVRGRLVDEVTGQPVIGMPAALYIRPAGSSWRQLTTATTNHKGWVGHRPKLARNTEVAWVSASTPTWESAVSSTPTVGVRTRVGIRASSTTVSPASTVTIRGKVAPNHADQRVVLQRRTRDGWRKVATTTLSSTSTYWFRYTMPASGKRVFRVVKAGDWDHLRGVSARLTVTVEG